MDAASPTATVAEVRTLLTWCWWVDTPISQQPVTGALQGHGCGRLLVWRRTGMNLPRHQHPWQSELSPKLGSFYLKTGVALWEGKMTAKPKLAFGESSCAQMTRCKWGDLSKVPGWGDRKLTASLSSETVSCAHSSTRHRAQEGSCPSNSDHWTLKSPWFLGSSSSSSP